MKPRAKITFIKTDAGFETPPDTRQIINDALLHRQEVNFKQIDPAEARSIDHCAYYWAVMLRMVAEYCEGMADYVTENERGVRNFNALHRHLTFEYCVRNNRPDLCNFYETIHNGERVMVPIASFDFEHMTHKDAVAYTTWVEDVFRRYVGGLGFKEMEEMENREVQ